MGGNLEVRTLNGKLIRGGFEVLTAVPNEQISECLTKIMLDIAGGRYSDLRIVHGDVALNGYEWQFEKPSHIFYVRYNQDHPNYDQKAITLVMPTLVHKESGERNSSLLLHQIL